MVKRRTIFHFQSRRLPAEQMIGIMLLLWIGRVIWWALVGLATLTVLYWIKRREQRRLSTRRREP